MESTIESIQKRYSVRNYNNKIMENEKLKQLLAYFDSNKKGPFNNVVRFQLIDALGYNERELKELGTYGFMKGARFFIAGSVARNKYAMEDYGYCMEKNILFATKLGLGTCWMGGSLNRSTFAQKIKLSDNEIIPAISPVGYAENKNNVKGKILALVTRSKQRKPAKEIFFNGDINNPIDLKECGHCS